jgi:hypothetical protein
VTHVDWNGDGVSDANHTQDTSFSAGLAHGETGRHGSTTIATDTHFSMQWYNGSTWTNWVNNVEDDSISFLIPGYCYHYLAGNKYSINPVGC